RNEAFLSSRAACAGAQLVELPPSYRHCSIQSVDERVDRFANAYPLHHPCDLPRARSHARAPKKSSGKAARECRIGRLQLRGLSLLETPELGQLTNSSAHICLPS